VACSAPRLAATRSAVALNWSVASAASGTKRADAGDYGALGEFIARAIMDNLYKFIVPAMAGTMNL
jgi:hypothetical protein